MGGTSLQVMRRALFISGLGMGRIMREKQYGRGKRWKVRSQHSICLAASSQSEGKSFFSSLEEGYPRGKKD